MLRKKIIGLLSALALAGVIGLVPAAAAQAAPAPAAPVAAAPPVAQGTLPVNGTILDTVTNEVTDFVGELSDLTVENVDGVLTLTGTLTGTGLPEEGVQFAQEITDMQANDTCDILNLDIGPIHLDLLGLVVDIDPIVIDITAERGPGNLLGNLLCTVAGLFDNIGNGGGSGGLGGVINGVVNILNRILSGLGL